jgi:hypothetical protein
MLHGAQQEGMEVRSEVLKRKGLEERGAVVREMLCKQTI